MPTYADLIASVESIMQDSSITDIGNRINSAVTSIAAGIRLPDGSISPPLPELYEMGAVPTVLTYAYASLPATYQRNVFLIADSNGNTISPPNGGDYYSFALFLKYIPKKDLSETGSVYRVAVKGRKLYYQGIPSASTNLTLHYYRKPVDMVLDVATPDGPPVHLQERLIVHYVCRDIFGAQLEDGENSSKMGASYHEGKFYEAMFDLIDFVGIDAEPEYYAGGNSGFQDLGICD